MREIKHQSRIDGIAQNPGLKMQMGSGGPSGIAAQRYGITGMDYVILVNQFPGQMTIYRFQPVGVANHQIMTVTATLVT